MSRFAGTNYLATTLILKLKLYVQETVYKLVREYEHVERNVWTWELIPMFLSASRRGR
jgi:hypothetical protein